MPNFSYSYEPIGLIPKSLFSTFERFFVQLFQTNNQEIYTELKFSRYQSRVSIRFILKLIFVPLILHYIGTNYMCRPAIKQIWDIEQDMIFINRAVEKEALCQLQQFEDELYFNYMLAPLQYEKPLWTIDPAREIDFPDLLKSQINTKSRQLAKQYNKESIEALTNCFGDFLVIMTILLIFLLFPTEYIICKSLLMEYFFSFNDIIKSTVFIFSTDLLVGFHSRRAWESFLEYMLQRLGFPPSDIFVHFFIGTIPVIIGAVFKYWVFRGLNNISPSTVGVYHSMME